MRDPHRILGVPPDATPDEIRRAYRTLAREHHPDATGRPETADHFAEIARAYELMLADHKKPARATRRAKATPADLDPDDPLPDAEETGAVYDAFFARSSAQTPSSRPRRVPFVRRAGTLDLELELPVTRAEAIDGASVSVPTADGPVTTRVPPGSETGAEIRLGGMGVRGASDQRGDLVLVLRVVPPSGDGVQLDD